MFFYTFISFSFSFEKEKGNKRTKESKKKNRGKPIRLTENSLKSRSEFWVVKNDVTAIIPPNF